jgi:flavorubredoxin
MQVQALLKKLGNLDIECICPLHGPILKENLGYYIDKYNTWSSYTPEDDGVTIAYASIHGNTAKAAKRFAEILEDKVTILAEIIEWPNEIDEDRAEAAKRRAEERLSSHASDMDVARAEIALQRALTRIEVLK